MFVLQWVTIVSDPLAICCQVRWYDLPEATILFYLTFDY